MPRVEQRVRHQALVNSGPLSLVMVLGMPKGVHQLRAMEMAMSFARSPLWRWGTATIQPLRRSTAMEMQS